MGRLLELRGEGGKKHPHSLRPFKPLWNQRFHVTPNLGMEGMAPATCSLPIPCAGPNNCRAKRWMQSMNWSDVNLLSFLSDPPVTLIYHVAAQLLVYQYWEYQNHVAGEGEGQWLLLTGVIYTRFSVTSTHTPHCSPEDGKYVSAVMEQSSLTAQSSPWAEKSDHEAKAVVPVATSGSPTAKYPTVQCWLRLGNTYWTRLGVSQPGSLRALH